MWREATPQDEPALISLCRELYREDPSPRPVPEAHMERTLRTFRSQPVRGRALVLELKAEIVGYCLLASFWSNELGGEVCFIDEFYIAPARRGHGQGSALVENLKSGSSLWPGKPVAIALEVTPQNARARALYSRLGFSDAKNATMRLLLS